MRGLTTITPKQGIIWGLAGFVAIQLAPAIGLPPVLPGTIGADVAARQAWWIGTIAASVVGLWIVAFGRRAYRAGGRRPVGCTSLNRGTGTGHLLGRRAAGTRSAIRDVQSGISAAGLDNLGFLAGWFWTREG